MHSGKRWMQTKGCTLLGATSGQEANGEYRLYGGLATEKKMMGLIFRYYYTSIRDRESVTIYIHYTDPAAPSAPQEGQSPQEWEQQEE